MYIKIVFISLLVTLISCQNEPSEALIPDFLGEFDVSDSEYNLSSIVESYKIIKLETSDDCILGGIRKIIKNNSSLFISANEELLQFDNEGNFIKKIGKKGRGPGEYLLIQDFAVNKDGSIVAICSQRNIQFYKTSDGSFIRNLAFDFYINSLFYLPNGELLVQVTQTDFLIAHLDTEGKILNKFGKISMALELEQPFEFVILDDSNIIYRIGQTTDYYQYNVQERVANRKQIFEHKNALREQDLHEKLVAEGPDPFAYQNLKDYFRSRYRILYMKNLNSSLLVYYFYEDKSSFLLFNQAKNTIKNLIFSPQESSNLIDDILFLPVSVFSQLYTGDSDDNSIITYITTKSFLKHFENGIPDSLKQSERFKEVLELIESLKPEDNPLIIEYTFKET